VTAREDEMDRLNSKVASAKVVASHSEGFDAALDKALLNASKLGRKGVFEVNIEFWAEIRVTNPGQIQQYGVTLTPRG
jgi:hypothetical protein